LKKMLKILIFLIFLSSCSKYYTSSGVIKKDEVWKGKIVLKGDIVIDEGVKLEIEPGTKIYYSKRTPRNQTHYIRNVPEGNVDVLQDERIEIVVEGVLIAKGKVKDPIIFNEGKNAGGIVFLSKKKGSIVEWVKFYDTAICIRCYGESSPEIKNIVIDGSSLGAIGIWDSSSPTISDSVILNSLHGIGIADFSKAKIFNNKIKYCKKAGIFSEGASKPLIKENVITGCNVAVAAGDISKPKIYNNLIKGNGAGISVWVKAEPDIRENRILKNITGIVIQDQSKPYIYKNLFKENGGGIGAKDATEVEIRENKFVSNSKSIIISGSSVAKIYNNFIEKSEEGIHIDEVSRIYEKENIFKEVKEKIKVLNRAEVLKQ